MTPQEIVAAIMKWPYLYETRDGKRLRGCPVSELPRVLRDAGYKNVGRGYSDYYALKDHGVTLVEARYIGGVRPKKFCDVVVAEFIESPYNLVFHEFMLREGATHERMKEHWEDVGDAENGPDLDGYAGHDLYELDSVLYAVFEDGKVDRCSA